MVGIVKKQRALSRRLFVVSVALGAFLYLCVWIMYPERGYVPVKDNRNTRGFSRSVSASPSISHELDLMEGVDVMQAPLTHGWVHKSGPAAVDSWHMSADARRRAQWDAFLEARDSGKVPMDAAYSSVPPHGPDPWGCRLYFNKEYKIFFVRTAKTGSTTILESVLPACVKSPDVPYCLQRVSDTQMSIEEVAGLWMDFTAFTFTRNVWSRAVSQYQYLVHFVRGNSSSNSLKCPRVTWNDFCEDPLILGKICRKEPLCCTKKWTHQDWHMRQQTSCFVTEDSKYSEWAVDFIGRLEHFDEDILELFKAVNKKRKTGLPPLVYEPQKAANSNPYMCTDTFKDGDQISKKNALKENADQMLEDYDSIDYKYDGKQIKSQSRTVAERNNSHRHVLGEFTVIDGNQLSDVFYCDKQQYYTGKHAKCLTTMTHFFSDDVSLLHQRQGTK